MEEKTESVNATTTPSQSASRMMSNRERPAAPSVANKACGRLEKLPYPRVLCGAKPRSQSASRMMSNRERPAAPSVANKACGRLEKLPYPRVLCGAKPRSHPRNSFNIVHTFCPFIRRCTCDMHGRQSRATPTN